MRERKRKKKKRKISASTPPQQKKIFPKKREPYLSEFSCLPQMKEELATAAVVENKI